MTDWTDYRRSNPELEATRERYNARFCGAGEPEPSLRPHFLIAVCAVVLIGFCLIASVGGMV
jgi:hypothetical protein